MKIWKKFGYLFMVLTALCVFWGTGAYAAEDQVSLSASFDQLELANDGAAAGNTTYQAETGSMWLSWQEKQPISAAEAPEPNKKMAGTSMTEGGQKDQALMVDIQAGSASNSMFNTNLDSDMDFYHMGKIEFSFNLYMDHYSGASHAPIQVDLRKDKNMVGSLISFRSSGQFQTFPGGVGGNAGAYQKKQWYWVKMEIDPQTRTYTLYLNDELVGNSDEPLANDQLRFPGDPTATSANTIKELRFSVNNGTKSTGSTVYIDDIYFGKVRSTVEEFTVSELFFRDGDNRVQAVSKDTKILQGTAAYLYSDVMPSQPVTLIAAMYDGEGGLQQLWQRSVVIEPAQEPGTKKGELTVDMDLQDMELTGAETFRLFIWNRLDGMAPLFAKTAQASVYNGESVGETPTLYLAGDSICVNYVNYNTSGDTEDDYKWYPQQGWGHCIGEFFNEDVTVDNRAYGGISTKTFRSSGRWEGIMDSVQPGDYVLISLGHNDQNSSAEDRYTTIEEYKENLSRFIDETRSKGANAVLITPVTMMGSGNSAQNFQNKLLERSNAMKEVAQEKQVTLLDVNGVTFAEFQEMGYQKACDAYFMSANAMKQLMEAGKLTQEDIDNHPNSAFKTNKQDLTHMTEAGAHYIAGKIAGLLRESNSPLKEKLLDTVIPEPEPEPDESYEWRYRETFEQQGAQGSMLSDYKISMANTQTKAGETALRAEIAQAPGEGQGNALKVILYQTDNSGYPYLDIALSDQIEAQTFVIDYKMWCQEKMTAHRKVGYRDENAAASMILLSYRATGKIQNSSSQEIGAYAAGDGASKWVRYQIVVDLKAGGYTVYADGVKMGEGTVNQDGRLKALRLTFENPNGDSEKPSVTYFDDMKVYTGPGIMPPEQDVDRTLSGRVVYNRYPDGKNKAVTFSFDDGKAEDRQTVAKLNEYNLKGTFNLVPKWLGTNTFITEEEVTTLYAGHEVANHGNAHSRIESQTQAAFQEDYRQGREALSQLAGYDVRGYVYPFGGITDTMEIPKITMDEVLAGLREEGAAYGRTTKEVTHFNLPSDFLKWDTQIRIGTSKKTENAMDMIQKFLDLEVQEQPQVLMIWGHSHEIGEYTLTGQSKTGWDLFDQMCQSLAGKNDIWYATNIEIVDYQKAVAGLVVSEEEKSIQNTSQQAVWIEVDSIPVQILPGETYVLPERQG